MTNFLKLSENQFFILSMLVSSISMIIILLQKLCLTLLHKSKKRTFTSVPGVVLCGCDSKIIFKLNKFLCKTNIPKLYFLILFLFIFGIVGLAVQFVCFIIWGKTTYEFLVTILSIIPALFIVSAILKINISKIIKLPQIKSLNAVSDIKYATLTQRVIARIVDYLVFFPIFIISFFSNRSSETPSVYLQLFLFFSWSLITIYFIICHKKWGQTLGKKLLNIHVFTSDLGSLSWRNALKSQFLSISIFFISLFFLLIGLFIAPFDKVSTVKWHSDIYLLFPENSLTFLCKSFSKYFNFFWLIADLIVFFKDRYNRFIEDIVGNVIVIKVSNKEQININKRFDELDQFTQAQIMWNKLNEDA
ncbi:MAG: RDD family protein [Oligoflexia bacterium]|nr:RDD family protein [Oligoflexia bacterium]